jgi:DNA-binding GntR family transcriptional regulator
VTQAGSERPSLPVGVIQQRSLRDIIADHVRDRIMRRELPPGARLDVVGIAEAFGASQGPVREALIVLESTGLVETKPRRGKFVARLTHHDLLEVYQVREIIDLAAADIVITRDDPVDLTTLRAACQNIRDAWAHGSYRLGIEADLEFHVTLSQLSGNSRLHAVATTMAHQTMMHLAPFEATSTVIDQEPPAALHEDIVDAIAAKDRSSASRAIREHYQYSRLRLDQHSNPR